MVPARNEADVVGSALASLAAQQYPGDFRIILVDDLIATPFRPDAEGYLTTPTGPGLGVELNREALKQYGI